AFDEAREKVAPQALVQYAATAIQLLEKRAAQFGADPVYLYALGTHQAALGRNAKARRSLEAAAALGEIAARALAQVPEPVVARAPSVGRNDPCPCGSAHAKLLRRLRRRRGKVFGRWDRPRRRGRCPPSAGAPLQARRALAMA